MNRIKVDYVTKLYTYTIYIYTIFSSSDSNQTHSSTMKSLPEGRPNVFITIGNILEIDELQILQYLS